MRITRRAHNVVEVVGRMSCGLDSLASLLPLVDALHFTIVGELIVAWKNALVAWLIKARLAAVGSSIAIVEVTELCVALSAVLANMRQSSVISLLWRHINGHLFRVTSPRSLLDRTLTKLWYFFASHHSWSHFYKKCKNQKKRENLSSKARGLTKLFMCAFLSHLALQIYT